MKGSKRIDSPPMITRKARVVANAVGDPCVMVYAGKGLATYSPMEARQLAKDINEALEALAGE